MAPPSGDYHLPSLSAVRPLPPLEALKSGWIFVKVQKKWTVPLKPNFLGRSRSRLNLEFPENSRFQNHVALVGGCLMRLVSEKMNPDPWLFQVNIMVLMGWQRQLILPLTGWLISHSCSRDSRNQFWVLDIQRQCGFVRILSYTFKDLKAVRSSDVAGVVADSLFQGCPEKFPAQPEKLLARTQDSSAFCF